MQEQQRRQPSGLEGFITSPIQEGYELFHQAQDIFAPENAEALKLVRHGESTYLVTPYYCPKEDSQQSLGSKDLDEQEYTIAALVDKTTDYKYRRGSPVYLIVNGVFENALQFETNASGLLHVGSPGDVIEDKVLSKLVAHIAQETRDEVVTLESSRRRSREERKHKFKVIAGTLALLGVLGGGATLGNNVYQQRQEDKRIAAEQAAAEARQRIVDFDNKKIVLPGTPIKGVSGYVASDPALFKDYVPAYKGTVETSPREIKVAADSCAVVANVPTPTSIKIVTNAAPESILVAHRSNGDIQICSGSLTTPSYKVAIQVAPATTS